MYIAKDNTLVLPDSKEYAQTIASLDARVAEEDGVAYFIRRFRQKKSSNWSYYLIMTQAFGVSLSLMTDGQLDTVNRTIVDEETLAKMQAIAKGWTMGVAINDIVLRPSIAGREYVVPHPSANNLSHEYDEYFAAGGKTSRAGRRILFKGMATRAFGRMSDESVLKIHDWAANLYADEEHKGLFTLGTGISLDLPYRHFEQRMDQEEGGDPPDHPPRPEH